MVPVQICSSAQAGERKHPFHVSHLATMGTPAAASSLAFAYMRAGLAKYSGAVRWATVAWRYSPLEFVSCGPGLRGRRLMISSADFDSLTNTEYSASSMHGGSPRKRVEEHIPVDFLISRFSCVFMAQLLWLSACGFIKSL